MNALERLGRAAKSAGEIEAEKRASGDREREARAAVLRTALELARPALPAIVTRTKFFDMTGERRVAMIGARGQVATQEEQPQRWQLYLAEDCVMLEDRRFWRDGAWHLADLRVIGPEEASQLFEPEDVVARLLRHCEAAIKGNNQRRTDEALARAARYGALAALLESIGGAP